MYYAIDETEQKAWASTIYQALRSVGLTVDALAGVQALIDNKRWQFFGHESTIGLAKRIIRSNEFVDVPISHDARQNNEVLKAAGFTIGARRRLRSILRNTQRSENTVLQVAELYVANELELRGFM